MVTLIARQSVIIKCKMQCAYLLGNYEFYYAAGLAGKLYGIKFSEDIKPKELSTVLAENLREVSSTKKQENYLISILKDYAPEERYDEQMKELLLWGQEETAMWQVSI